MSDHPIQRVYVASSWRNDVQPLVVEVLRAHRLEVYDFRHPSAGFAWSDIDPDWEAWTPAQFAQQLEHPQALKGFASDFEGMRWADACVMVQPCGVSAALEAAWIAGRGWPTCALLHQDERFEPELMLGLLDRIFVDLAEVVEWLKETRIPLRAPMQTPAAAIP